MKKLEDKLKCFSLSKASRNKMLENEGYVPSEFIEIAKIVLAGHFIVTSGNDTVLVCPTSVEFYYHEEIEGGIKDFIVYHRNTGKSLKDVFETGILHNHVSGIDITFEQGDSPETAIRASILIREFEIEGKNDCRSTSLYEALYQQASVFNGFSIKWVDGVSVVDVVAYPRKNVAKYDKTGNKMSAKSNPESLCTEDKKYVQDMRKWQFKKMPITDEDTNIVYISDLLADECPDFYKRFVKLLQTNKIPFDIIPNTNDIWARDYMPIQIYSDHFVEYCYNPDYLQSTKDDKDSITDTSAVCKELGISCYKTDLVIDGGNVVKAGRFIIMTEKVYAENKHLSPAIVRERLKEIFHREIIMLPWDKNERYGHADGIVKAIDDQTVLLTNYEDYDSKFAARFEKILSEHFTVRKLCYDVKQRDKNNWAYINFLRVGNHLIVPGLGTMEDEQAIKQISRYYPTCNILQIEASEIINKGGALNCITWNIKR